jgi:hypothetical protein
MSKVVFKNYPKGTFDVAVAPFFGAGIELSSPSIGSRIDFLIEAWYSKNTFKGEVTRQRLTNESQIDKYEINVKYFRVPVGIKYYLKKGNVSPYIKAGFSYYRFSKKSATTVTQVIENTSTAREPELIAPVNSGQITGWAGPGLQIKMGSKSKLQLEAQYEQGSGVAKSDFHSNQFSNIILLVAVTF